MPTADYKQLVRSAFNTAHCRAWYRQHSPHGQRRRRVRQRTVEPVFGNLRPHYGRRRVGTRSCAAAHKTLMISVIAFNLKKLFQHQSKRVASLALALLPTPLGVPNRLFKHWLKGNYLFCEYSLN